MYTTNWLQILVIRGPGRKLKKINLNVVRKLLWKKLMILILF